MFARIVIAGMLLLVSVSVSAQQVDPHVDGIDPSVDSRVRDPDRPDSALLPGGSAAWTGQPIMSEGAGSKPLQKSGASSTASFPSLAGAMSTWGTLSIVKPSPADTGTTLGPAQTNSRQARVPFGRKVNPAMAKAAFEIVRSSRVEEDVPADQNQPSSPDLKYRQLKRATTKSTRLRVKNPLRSRADVVASTRWGADSSSAYALEQRRHQGSVLLHSGFSTQSERKKRRHRGTPTPGQR